MSTEFFSQATNFQSTATGRVDPRTGLFNYVMPVAHLIGNNRLGPEQIFALTYSPLNGVDRGFGIGFSLGLTQYDAKNRLLMLSTGEQYKVFETDEKVTLKQYKQDVVRFEKDVVQNVYRVIHKSGLVEILNGSRHLYDLKVPTQIVNPLGYTLKLDWIYDTGAMPRLTAVSDEGQILLKIHEKTAAYTYITVWPESSESYGIRLLFENDKVTQINNETSNQTLIWKLEYDSDSGFLTRVLSPTGNTEFVDYDFDGHQFPEEADLPPLPYVTRYIQHSKQNPEIIRHYEYTESNFLGYGSKESWNEDEDYLYGVLTDYHYGSTEYWDNGHEQRSITRLYNNYHLLISENVQQNSCQRQHETKYYARIGLTFDEQPKQFQLPESATVRFISDSGQREEETQTEFDSTGNPTVQIAPDGTRTDWVYYPAAGDKDACPADPHGFVRYVKSKTVTPGTPSLVGSYDDAPIHQVIYRYDTLPTLPGAPCAYAVVRTYQGVYSAGQLLHESCTRYVNQLDSPHHGRMDTVEKTVYSGQGAGILQAGQSWTHRQAFHYTLTEQGALERTVQWIGHDGLTDTHTESRSYLSGKVWYEEDSQSCTTQYHYDVIGRLLKQVANIGTEYTRNIEYAYAIEQTGMVNTMKTDPLGNLSRTWFDGQGQAYQHEVMRKGQEAQGWLRVLETERDSWGRVVSETHYDWLPTGTDPAQLEKISVSRQTGYDNWGQVCLITDATGTQFRQDYDPVTLTTQQTTEAGSLKFSRTETLYNLQHQPLSVTQYDSAGQQAGQHRYQYDGLGRLRVSIDAQDQKTVYTYDAFNRVSLIQYSDDTKVRKTYAPFSAGDLVVKIEVDGKTLGLREFDSLGRVTSTTVGGRTQTATYQGACPEPEIVTDPLGQRVQFQYEPRLGNVPIRVESPNLTQKLTYDAKSGEMTRAEAVGQATQQYTYTTEGWLQQETVQFDDAGAGPAHSTMYHYSPTGQPTAYQDMTGRSYQLQFDLLGRPMAAVDDEVTVTLRYDATGRMDCWTVLDNKTQKQLTTTLTFDDFNREIERQIENGTDTLTLKQTYTITGQLASRITDSSYAGRLREEHYTYDMARSWLIDYQCTGIECPQDAYGNTLSRQQFTYDRLGNILTCITILEDGSQDSAHFCYDNLDDPCQLTRITHSHPAYPSTIILTYDKAGRLIEDEAGRVLSYDGLGRLASVTQEDTTQTYRYDAIGRLALQQRDKEATRELYYQGSCRVAEIQRENGAVTRLVQADSVPAAMVTDSGVHLLGTDKPGSVLLSVKNGTTARFRYTPYGQQAAANSDPALPGYNGEWQDSTGGGYHLGNGYRTYNPVLMRFTAPDSLSPFGEGGLNPYAYCLGDPINRTDPSGHVSILGLVFGGISMFIGLGLGILGIISAVPTGGASLALLMGVITAVGFVGDACGIASTATQESDPRASAILSWVFLGLGVVGLLGGLGVTAFYRSAKVAREAGFVLSRRSGMVVEGGASTLPANVRQAFKKAVNSGWIEEIEFPQYSGKRSLVLKLPKATYTPSSIRENMYPFLEKMGFNIQSAERQGVGDILSNVVPRSSGGVDINVNAFKNIYLPLKNIPYMKTGGVNFIRYNILNKVNALKDLDKYLVRSQSIFIPLYSATILFKVSMLSLVVAFSINREIKANTVTALAHEENNDDDF
ncbi:putative Nematicidal protein 2 [Xenorhabdus poinarii G6]|uniref:Putative Nematicidal protein 2 n=1 Tax=Xenorhabdus poinarii G6 TaxID=1354304 RepID=A0A068QYS6_9GAMM|nr:RHS repeat-associated core domain-containing protein [Xenorhabdus poinarii]CDG19786.1 putative Nematicidal protein 2 [Xenorhabdus poinarii G6]